MRILLGFVIFSAFFIRGIALGEPAPEENRGVRQRQVQKAPGLILSFEGGVAGINIATALDVLSRHSVLPLVDRRIVAGENLCSILADRGYPPPCEPFQSLVARINSRPEIAKGLIRTDDVLKLPDVTLIKYSSAVVLRSDSRSDDRKSENYLKNFTDLNVRRIAPADNNLTAGSNYAVTFDAFRFYVATNDDLQSALIADQLRHFPGDGVLIDILRIDPIPAKGNSNPSVKDIRDECKILKKLTLPFDYGAMADPDTDALPFLPAGLPPSPTNVIVIDIPLKKSPNLLPAIGESPATNKWDCKWSDNFDGLKHHSTHLSGIIASSSHGFKGLAKSARLLPFEWAKASDSGNQLVPASPDRNTMLADTISERSTDPLPLNVYLAAVNFDPVVYAGNSIPPSLLSPKDRTSSRQLERRLLQYKPLLIAAAGQADPGQNPIEIRPTANLFPANLGDFSSVVVVTACDMCQRSDAHLMTNANFGVGDRNFVHVAAPGGFSTPGWISETEVGSASGTSQAAAYVAGVAASMISYFPLIYKDASEVKARLQVTSTPLQPVGLSAHPDAAHINAGIVDPVLALLDPTKHWIKRNGVWQGIKFRATPISLAFALKDSSNGADVYLRSRIIRRLYKTQLGGSPAWMVYTDYGQENDNAEVNEIKRYGPLSSQANTKLVQICGGTGDNWLTLADLDDLIIAKQGIKSDECSH